MDDPTAPWSSSLDGIATSTLSAAVGLATSILLNSTNPEGDSPFINDPLSSTPLEGLPDEGNPILNFLLGFIIIIGASILNAFGLNVTKLDHNRASFLPKASRTKDYLRPLWLLGMAAYIASQLFGSTLSLKYLRSEWVAPLGSSSLIFNFLFAKWLVGTPVTKEDYRGTAAIVVGVVGIVGFSSINHGLDGVITLHRLATNWSRGNWIAWFILVALSTIATFYFTHLLHALLVSRASLSPVIEAFDPSLPPATLGGRRARDTSNTVVRYWRIAKGRAKWAETKALGYLERLFERSDDARIRFFEGIGWAVVGGSLAGGCLVFTKAVVKLLGAPGHPFTHPTALFTLLMVALTAVFQIICLNSALKAAESTLVVPIFYAGYTILGFINALIFLNETGQYETWVLVCIFGSISILLGGVVLLSMKNVEDVGPDGNPQGSGVGSGQTIEVGPRDRRMRMHPPSNSRLAKERSKGSSHENGNSTYPPGSGSNGPRGPMDCLPSYSSARSTRSKSGGGGGGGGGGDGVWEVGSVSDSGSDDDNEKKDEGRGVGGIQGNHGERGGLLFDAEADAENDGPTSASSLKGRSSSRKGSRVGGDDDEDDDGAGQDDNFGDFKVGGGK